MSRTLKLLIGVPLAALVLAVGGTWVYINLIKEDAPERLTLDTGATTTAAPAGGGDGDPTSTTAVTGTPAAAAGGVDGTWEVTTGSTAGYRANEVLFGQSTTAVGRTSDVTGRFSFAGSTLTAGSFTVDLTTVASDESRRDNQFKGRIMDVATYPTATFELTGPVEVALPADGQKTSAQVTGDLTLRGTTKSVKVTVEAQQTGGAVRVAGSIPIVFDEWGIPSPTFGPAQVEDHGEIEFLLVFARA